MSRKAVFLDRDGIISRVVFRDEGLSTPFTLSEMEFYPQVGEAVELLKEKGFLCIVITNQPEAGKNFPLETLWEMHDRLKNELGIDQVYSCSHGNDAGCTWYKPQPGMILQAVKDFDIDLKSSFVIGDRWRDMDLGKNTGCRRVLVVSEATIFDNRPLESDFKVTSLFEAAELIVKINTP